MSEQKGENVFKLNNMQDKKYVILTIVCVLIVVVFFVALYPNSFDKINSSGNDPQTSFSANAQISILYTYNSNFAFEQLLNRYKNESIEKKQDSLSSLRILAYPETLFHSVFHSSRSSNLAADIVMFDHPYIFSYYSHEGSFLYLQNALYSDHNHLSLSVGGDALNYLTPAIGINAYVLYCNDDLLGEAGISLNSISPDILINACSSLKKLNIPTIAFASLDFTAYKNMIVQLCTTADPSQMWISAQKLFYSVSPYMDNAHLLMDSNDARTAFRNGEYAFYFGTEADYEYFSQNTALNFSCHCMSEYGRKHMWYDYVGMFAIDSDSQNKVAALEIADKLSSTDSFEWYQKNAYALQKSKKNPFEGAIRSSNWIYNEYNGIIPYDQIQQFPN